MSVTPTLSRLGIRRADRRDTAIGFVTLFCAIAGHSVLETARDSLFLASLPASDLPWAYLTIAAVALVTTRLNEGALARLRRRRILSTTLLLAAAATFGFYVLFGRSQHTAPFALYVWTGMVATTVVVQFWILLGDVLDVAQAKRLFSIIAAGGLLGAATGSGLARLTLFAWGSRELLLLSAGLFGIASLLPLGFSSASKEVSPTAQQQRQDDGLLDIVKERYLRRLLMIALIAPIALTVSDYLFKSMVARHVESAELGAFFANFYAVLNLIALIFQLALAPHLLRAVGVGRSLFLLPALMLVSAGGFAAAPALLPVLLLKGVDGALRHSIHRSATEILFLPLATRVRERLRGLAGSIGDRGGQAIASLCILMATWFGATLQVLAVGLAAIMFGWLVALVGLRKEYANRFRQRLREGSIETRGQVPTLDLYSLEALLRALGSSDEAEVLAALDMFEAYGKTSLLSPLILYHPSPEVVLRALVIFRGSMRPDVAHMVGRMTSHPNAQVRAAAIQSAPATELGSPALVELLSDPSSDVQAAALGRLAEHGWLGAKSVSERLHGFLEAGADKRRALARAAGMLPVDRFADLLGRLADSKERDVATEAARAIAQSAKTAHIPYLLKLLRFRESRRFARPALVALGKPALRALESAFRAPELSATVRLHIPRTISRFETQAALDVLTEQLSLQHDHRLHYKILRAIGRMRADKPQLTLDKESLMPIISRSLVRAVELLEHRLNLPRKDTAERAWQLLATLLGELEEDSLERLFRLLHILEPRQEYQLIYDGLSSSDSGTRAASRELLEHVVEGKLRDAILIMTDDLPEEERLAAVQQTLGSEGRGSTRALLELLLQDEHPAVRSLTAFLVDEQEDEAVTWAEQVRRERQRVTLPSAVELSHAR